MGDKKTYIELNGIRYDAQSGKILDTHEAVTKTTVLPTSGGAIDGFARRPAQPAIEPIKLVKPRTSAGQNSKQLHSSLQKSKTLMRPAVTKPKLSKTHTRNKPPEPAAKPLIAKAHTDRLKRAQAARKSNIISRFYNGTGATGLKKKTDSLPVAPAPKSTHSTDPSNVATLSAQPASALGKRFESAIHNSTSHLNTHKHTKSKKPRRLTIAASSLAIALLAGFFTYQNVPNLQMRVASTRAGFSASLPGYSPAGFGIAGPIQTEPGKVTVTFRSRTDDRAFQVKQQVSEWSSTALLNNYVEKKDDHQTFSDDRGRTLYIYGDSNVTWVDGGVWYVVEGNASLSNDQMLRIANSL